VPNQHRLTIVGVDGWPAADRALAWALDLAGQTGATVEVITAWSRDGIPSASGTSSVADERERAANVQSATVERALSGRPASPVVSMQVIGGSPGEVLVDASRRADLLVLGSHGHRRAYDVTVGSTSDHCLRNAHCPVVVIPVPVFDERAGRDAVASGGPG